MKKLLLATATAGLLSLPALADVKVGMITTLSGGGAGLGVDVRDGFMLAIEQSGRTDIEAVSYTHLTLPTMLAQCRSRWSPGQ